jgi:hypothetical protein
MDLLRSLAVPLHLTSLLFVAISGLLIPLLSTSLLGLVPLLLLLSWLFKYGYVMLERVANGRFDAPVASLDMLGPFEARPWVQLFIVVVAYAAIRWIGGSAGRIAGAVALVLLPASVCLTGTAGSVFEAVNPLALWRVLRGFGAAYVLVLAVVAAMAGAAVLLARAPVWPVVRYALWELQILATFSFLGGVIYVRRLQVGFEPHVSPERAQVARDAARRQRRQRMLDEVYGLINARQYERAPAPLTAWLTGIDNAHVAEDVHAITTAVLDWHNPYGISTASRCLIGWLIAAGKPVEAVHAMHSVLEKLPNFTLDSEPSTLALAQQACRLGQPRFALRILTSFAEHMPEHPLGAAAQSLRADLSARA